MVLEEGYVGCLLGPGSGHGFLYMFLPQAGCEAFPEGLMPALIGGGEGGVGKERCDFGGF